MDEKREIAREHVVTMIVIAITVLVSWLVATLLPEWQPLP